MLAAIVKKKRISKGFTDDLCSTTVQVDLIVRKDMKKSLKGFLHVFYVVSNAAKCG